MKPEYKLIIGIVACFNCGTNLLASYIIKYQEKQIQELKEYKLLLEELSLKLEKHVDPEVVDNILTDLRFKRIAQNYRK